MGPLYMYSYAACILMAFVTTVHLQASADAALYCKPGRLATRGGPGLDHLLVLTGSIAIAIFGWYNFG